MKEVALMQRLHNTFKKHCSVCSEDKHISKFRRFSAVRKTCNECYLKKPIGGKENEIQKA